MLADHLHQAQTSILRWKSALKAIAFLLGFGLTIWSLSSTPRLMRELHASNDIQVDINEMNILESSRAPFASQNIKSQLEISEYWKREMAFEFRLQRLHKTVLDESLNDESLKNKITELEKVHRTLANYEAESLSGRTPSISVEKHQELSAQRRTQVQALLGVVKTQTKNLGAQFLFAQNMPLLIFIISLIIFRLMTRSQNEVQALLQQINDTSPSMVYIFNLSEGRVTYCNSRVKDIIGLSQTEIVGQGNTIIKKIVHPEDQENVQLFLSNCKILADGEISEIRYRVLHPNGHLIWLRDRITAFSRDAEGQANELLGISEDITQLVQSENINKILVDLIDNSPDLFGYCDSIGRPIYVNRAAHRLGWTAAHSSIADFVAPDFKAAIMDSALPKAASGQVWAGETKLMDLRTGQSFSAYQRLFAVRDAAGVPLYYATVASDLSDEKQLQKDLEAEKQRKDMALRTANIGIFEWDVARDEMIWDEHHYRIYGTTPEQLQKVYRNWKKYIHHDDYEYVERAIESALKGPNDLDCRFRIVRPDGETRHLRCKAVVIRDNSNSPIRMIGLSWDVTHEEHLKQKIKESEAELGHFITNLPTSVALFDRSLKYLSYSQLWLIDHGMERNHTTNSTFLDLFPGHRAEWEERVQSVLEGHLLWKEEESIVDQKGRTQWFRWVLQPVRRQEETVGFICLTELITDKKKMSEELEAARVRQVTSSRLVAMGEMAAGIAHEINNPLSVISGRAQSLMLRLETQSDLTKEQILDTLMKINQYTERIAKIVRGLKAFSRDGSADPLAPANLNEIINDSISLMNERFKNHGVDLQVELPEGQRDVPCRPVQISQILTNLLTNALDAVRNSSNPWIRVRVTYEPKFAVIRVHDSGSGVSDDNIQKIFQPFFTTKEVGKGTGLGLSISIGLAREHGGSLELDRSVSKSCFVLRLPYAFAKSKSGENAA